MSFDCRPHLMHDSSEILHIRNSCYKQEVKHVRQHFQKQYQNWIILDGLKSKWWIWNMILQEVSISMKYIHSYLERTKNSKYWTLMNETKQKKEKEKFFKKREIILK